MTATIHTPSGTITSIGTYGVKPTSISWRTDGPTAHEWPSVEAATAWMDLVWLLDPREKARCGWTILEEPPISDYPGPDCTNPSEAGDWCGECAECEAAVEWLRQDLAGSQGV